MHELLETREHSTTALRVTPQQLGALAAVARGRVELLATGQPLAYELRTGHHVGTLAVPGLNILIRPKAPLANVFTMLGVPGATTQWQDDPFGYGTERRLLPAFAALFARAAARALGRGPLRTYRDAAERLPALRGRVDFGAQVRLAGVELPVACRYQEFTSDVLENRALRAAIRTALRISGVPDQARGELLHQLARLEDVADVHVDPDAIDRLHIHRLNRHYAPALHLAAIILRATTLVTTPGGADASAFLIDMNKLFESFVADRLRRHLRGRLKVQTQVTLSLDVGGRVTTRPDLLFERDGRPVLVADTKYKLVEARDADRLDAIGHHADYYQILSYATLTNLPAGLLIYCHTGGGAPPRRIVVRHGGQSLWAYPVSLAGTPVELEVQMKGLAEFVAEVAVPRAG